MGKSIRHKRDFSADGRRVAQMATAINAAEAKRIIVIGCPGSGKSTFSRALRGVTGLPLCHLDCLFWNPDGTTVGQAAFRERLRAVLEEPAWIIDGNYGSTLEQRLRACDTVFFLDYPTELCLEGIRARRGRPRSDMPWVEDPDAPDADFEAYVRDFAETSRPGIIELLKAHADKRVVTFRRRDEAETFLDGLRARTAPARPC